MHRGASSSLCVRTKNRQISVRGEWFADGAAQVRSPIHTYAHLVCEPFASDLRNIRRARVYEALGLACPFKMAHLKGLRLSSVPFHPSFKFIEISGQCLSTQVPQKVTDNRRGNAVHFLCYTTCGNGCHLCFSYVNTRV